LILKDTGCYWLMLVDIYRNWLLLVDIVVIIKNDCGIFTININKYLSISRHQWSRVKYSSLAISP
jgi:hypothetical protein